VIEKQLQKEPEVAEKVEEQQQQQQEVQKVVEEKPKGRSRKIVTVPLASEPLTPKIIRTPTPLHVLETPNGK
jgi:hypothetical protein